VRGAAQGQAGPLLVILLPRGENPSLPIRQSLAHRPVLDL